MAARFFLRTMGLPELRAPGGEPVRFRTRKHLALLVFMAVERNRLHPRDRLAELLWPEARPSEGRHSLATALSVIRARLGPRAFESSRDAVRLAAPDLEVDLDRLERGEVLGDEDTPPLEVAGFLEEFEVTRAHEYMFWRDLTRARLFPAIRQGLVALMDRCRRTGAFSRIEAHADRLLVLDELAEEGIRAKMEARAFDGDRLSALRIYKEWRQRLEGELGAAPSPLVEGMALRLRQRGYEPPGTAHIPTVHTDQWRNRAFIGRAEQYRVLYERWESTQNGHGHHGLVLGESGIGKTTLVERLVTAAGLEGAVSSRVQCYEVDREIPYAAVGTLVRGLLDHPGASGTPPEWLAELSWLVPAVARRYPNLPPPRKVEGEAARFRLAEGLHELVSAVAEEHPAILVVDDVHLADDASVAVLHLLMRRTREQPVMVILTARPGELGRSPHASRLIEHREPLTLCPVDLAPLTADEIRDVILALARAVPVELPPAVCRAVQRAAAGVPLLAELLFEDWRHEGDRCLALTVGAMTVDASGGGAGREAGSKMLYERVFERTLGGLTPAARAVLNLAAILGDRLNDLQMYDLVDLTLAQTLAGMAELTEVRVLRDGGREMEFRNELLRDYAYMNIPSPLRRALHGHIADRLIAAEASGEKIPGLMMAWHCFRAGRVAVAAPYLLRGAREALDKGAAFEVELALTSGSSELSFGQQQEAQLLLTEALQEQGRWGDSLNSLKAVVPQDGEQSSLQAVLDLAARSQLATTDVEAREHIPALLALLASRPTPDVVSRAMVALGRLTYLTSDRQSAALLLSRSAEEPVHLYSIGQKLRLATTEALLLWLTRQVTSYQSTLETLETLQATALQEGIANASLANLYNVKGCLLTSLGRYSSAVEAFENSYRASKNLGDTGRESIAASNLGMCFGRLGQYDKMYEWETKALAHDAVHASPWIRASATCRAAWALAMQGENSKALAFLNGNSGTLSVRLAPWAEQAKGVLSADVLWVAGDEKKAANTASQTLEQTNWAPLSNSFAGAVYRWVARCGVESRGEHGRAQQLLDQAYREIDLHDTLDQAEILTARIWFYSRLGTAQEGNRRELGQVLSRLPDSIHHHFSRLGMLSA